MNNLLNPNGGMPLYGDDLRFIQESYFEGFKALLAMISEISPNGFIISGCKVTQQSGTFDVSEGYICIQGEICYAPAVSAVPNSFIPTCGYVLNTYYDPTGNHLFDDGILRDKYEVRQASLALVAGSGAVSLEWPLLPTYTRAESLLMQLTPKSERDWAAMNGLSTNWEAVGVGDEALLIIKQFSKVSFRGRVQTIGLAAPVITVLSPPFRPKFTVSFLVPWGLNGIMRIIIETNGQVSTANFQNPTSGNEIDLTSVQFTVE